MPITSSQVQSGRCYTAAPSPHLRFRAPGLKTRTITTMSHSHSNHIPKPPIETYPLFLIVGVPLAYAGYLMYEKLANDKGVTLTTQRWKSDVQGDIIISPPLSPENPVPVNATKL